jgi:hypothetical protein
LQTVQANQEFNERGPEGLSVVRDLVEISLAKALKLKNRLAGRVAKLDADLAAYNSVLAGSDQPDIRRMYAERQRLVGQLIELKVAINAANQPAQRTIFLLGEQKSLVALLGHGGRGVPRHPGPVRGGAAEG